MSVHLGIGSWTDPIYSGVLFPEDLPAKERLAHYSTVFDHVEVNSSFYRTPTAATTSGWAQQTRPGFIFHLKLHRAFSQSPAKSAQEGKLGEYLLEAAAPLIRAGKLGAFLLVMPPSFGPDKRKLAELDGVIEKLQPHTLAVELRHSAWVAGGQRDHTLGYFRERKLTWVAVDMPRIKGSTIMPAIDEVTNPDLAYLRLHGRNSEWLAAKSAADRHLHDYTAPELKEIVARVETLSGAAKHVHVVANNHALDFAPKAALALQGMLGKAAPPSASKARPARRGAR